LPLSPELLLRNTLSTIAWRFGSSFSPGALEVRAIARSMQPAK
jgi:hypothetical protein